MKALALLVALMASSSAIAGVYYVWGTTSGSVVCEERTDNGKFLKDVADKICMREKGFFYDWGTTNGQTVCELRSSDGRFMKDVDINICRNSSRLGSSYIRKLNAVSNTNRASNSSRPSWKFAQHIDGEGRLIVAASIKETSKNTKVTMTCRAPEREIFMGIEVSELVWKAAQALTEIDKETLKVEFSVKSASGRELFETNDWILESNNIFLKLDPVDLELIESFEAGSTVNMKITAIGNTELDNEPFELVKTIHSLRGSQAVLEKVQNMCSGIFN